MNKVYYRKLIRDKIPEVMRAKGKAFSVHPLGQKAFEKELLRKVEEEASALPNVKTRAELISRWYLVPRYQVPILKNDVCFEYEQGLLQ